MNNVLNLIKWHWNVAKECQRLGISRSKVNLFLNSIYFHKKYSPLSYKDYCSMKLSEMRNCPDLIEIQRFKKQQRLSHKVLNRYSFMGQESLRRRAKRNKRYTKAYNMGNNCRVENNVLIRKRHILGREPIAFGNDVSIAKDVDLDYTGKLTIGNCVNFGQGTIILTHCHDLLGFKKDADLLSQKMRVYTTPLIIEDNVDIGARCIILPGVSKIGKNSIISAGSVVNQEVPANSMVGGNPAVIMGVFPSEMKVFNVKQ